MIYDILLSLVENPVAIPAYAVFLMSAAMFPLGFMLGSPCSACCGCAACLKGVLPETVTVTLSNYSDEKFPTQWLALFRIRSTFWQASGGAGYVTQPDACGTPDTFPGDCDGPITALAITETGTGYAKHGHRPPVYLEASVLFQQYDGKAATVTTSWAKTVNESYYKLPAFMATSPLSIKSGGTEYEYGMSVQLSAPAEEGMFVQSPQLASGWVKVQQSAPDLVLDTSSLPGVGLDATLTIAPYTWTKYPAQPRPGMLAWTITGAVINNGGTGYKDDMFVVPVLGEGNVQILAGDLRIRTVRAEPVLEVQILQTQGGGSGAAFQINYTQTQGPSQLGQTIAAYYSPQWRIASVTVTNGGSGYSPNDTVAFNMVDAALDYFAAQATATISVDPATGAILSVNLDPAPSVYPFKNYYYRDTGVVDRVGFAIFTTATPAGGLYYKTDGVATEIVLDVSPAGLYWVEDPTIPPLVAEDITFLFTQYYPSVGVGAELEAVIDEDTSSATFGHIIDVNVINGGDGYLARWWSDAECCEDYWNGKSFVLQKYAPCKYRHSFCATHTYGDGLSPLAYVDVEYKGIGGGAVVTVSDGGCSATMTASGESIVDCGEFSFEATLLDGPTATVVAGGEYDAFAGQEHGSHPCHPCCRSEQESTPNLIKAKVKDTVTGELVPFGVNQDYGIITELIMSKWAAGVWRGVAFTGGLMSSNFLYPVPYYVRITPCSQESGAGGWESVQGSECDSCWKQCEVQFLGDNGFSLQGAWWYLTERCSNCNPFPVCDALTGMDGEIPLLSDFDQGPNAWFIPGFGYIPGPNKIGELPPFPTKYVLTLEAAG